MRERDLWCIGRISPYASLARLQFVAADGVTVPLRKLPVVLVQRCKGWTVLLAVAATSVVLGAGGLWWVVAWIFHWRFQFSVRTLLLLAVAVALPFSWLAVEMKKAREEREAVVAIVELRGACSVTGSLTKTVRPRQRALPLEPPWLRRCLGEFLFSKVVRVSFWGDTALQIADAGLVHCARLEEQGVVSQRDAGHGFRDGTSHRTKRTREVRISMARGSRTKAWHTLQS